MDIRYKIKKFNLTIDSNNKPRRNWVGFWHRDNFGYTDNVRLARSFTKDELENEFSEHDVFLMKKDVHEKYFLIQECKKLDKIFNRISGTEGFRTKDFKVDVIKEHHVKGLESKILTTKKYNEKWKQFDRVIKFEDIEVKWGEDSRMSTSVFIDKLRRKFDYDNPYIKEDFIEYYQAKGIGDGELKENKP